MSNTTKQAPPFNACRRCGTCCRKGGPALHLEDQELVESGQIPLQHLLTIRQGEPAYDNVTATIAPAVTDIIIINSRPENAPYCVFFNPDQKSCRIYDARPSECEALKCWDTGDIKSLYNCRRLTRRHLLSRIEGLWELVEDHQARCNYGHIADLAARIRQQRQAEAAGQELLGLIRYDRHLRQIALERTQWKSEMLLFLFGRPLSFTIDLFQLKTTRRDGCEIIVSTAAKGEQVCYRRKGLPS